MKAQPRTLVVTATYNELENLPRLTDEVFRLDLDLRMLVVDDNSPDGTGRWCDRRAAKDPRFRVLHRASKQGLGTATKAGFQYALDHDFEWVLVLDADLSHPPHSIPRLLAGMAGTAGDGDYDVMIGSRYVPGGRIEGWPRHRRWISRCLNLYARWWLGLQARDCSGSFRCYRCDLLRQIGLHNLRSRGYAYLEELLWQAQRAGARIGEVPITFSDRQFGETKISAREALAAVLVLFRLGLRHRFSWNAPAPRRS